MNLSALITALGGRQTLQQLLGVGSSAVSNYMTRGHLPERAKARIYDALTAKGYQLCPDTLDILVSPEPETGSTADCPHILLIVAGGIAAYKALETARQMMQAGARVTGVMTESAKQFISPLSLGALTGEKCYDTLFSLTDEAEMGHINLARSADLVLVVPATANIMARAANGFADDLATTVILATASPVAMAPAMNPVMWANPATQANLALLQQRGVHIIGPASGDTACGEEGKGRMSEPADIVAKAMALLRHNRRRPLTNKHTLANKHILVTSGPTVEPIDSVRFIANHSSGKQGHAIAAALAARGASVTLVSGPVAEPPPPNVTVIRVQTAAEMLSACMASLPSDIAICAAAVADWHVDNPSQKKLKKPDDASAGMTLTLRQNPDILAELAASKNRPELVIGFAAETDNLQANAVAKRQRKGCDWIIANQVAGADDPVFGSASNTAMLITETDIETWPQMLKTDLAERLADKIEAEFAE